MAADLAALRSRLAGFFEELYPDPEVAESDLASASAEVDAVAMVRYALPLADCRVVDGWVLTLAEELAWSRRSSGKLPENVIDRVKSVRKSLEMLAAGTLALPGQTAPAAAGGSAGASGIMYQCDTPEYTSDKLGGY